MTKSISKTKVYENALLPLQENMGCLWRKMFKPVEATYKIILSLTIDSVKELDRVAPTPLCTTQELPAGSK